MSAADRAIRVSTAAAVLGVAGIAAGSPAAPALLSAFGLSGALITGGVLAVAAVRVSHSVDSRLIDRMSVVRESAILREAGKINEQSVLTSDVWQIPYYLI